MNVCVGFCACVRFNVGLCLYVKLCVGLCACVRLCVGLCTCLRLCVNPKVGGFFLKEVVNDDSAFLLIRSFSHQERVKKIFVGGVSPDLPESEIRFVSLFQSWFFPVIIEYTRCYTDFIK